VKRLYLQIYVTIIAILLLVMAVVGGLARYAFDETRFDDMLNIAGELAVHALPPPDAAPDRQQAVIDSLHRRLRIDLALYARNGERLAAAGRPLPQLELDSPSSVRLRGGRDTWLLPLNDGRFLVAGAPHGSWRPGRWALTALGLIAIAVAIGAWPLTRRLTRRLERLKQGVDQLGTGDLAARVAVEGKDEVAALAASFNRSASQIEELVRSKRMLLANASHELRTPLTRINMAIAMAGDEMSPEQRAHVLADIAELDQLIEEILLASRLEATGGPDRSEEIDLLALAAEEAARDGIGVEGTSVSVRGERALLRRMVRNLIDNARRHGGDAAPEVRVSRQNGRAVIAVRDHGPGIPADERERIFEPFYRLAGSAETGKGSGLGLALVRQIARHHGGDVQCNAAEGGGSLFAITLPPFESASGRTV
jgi:signal transduction histidine kinase